MDSHQEALAIAASITLAALVASTKMPAPALTTSYPSERMSS